MRMLRPDEYEARVAAGFRNPGGESALRQGKLEYPCPTCGEENVLSKADVERGYQCDACAEREELGF